MTTRTWRINTVGTGALAWVYVRTHGVTWTDTAVVAAQRLEITEERQNLVDDLWQEFALGK